MTQKAILKRILEDYHRGNLWPQVRVIIFREPPLSADQIPGHLLTALMAFGVENAQEIVTAYRQALSVRNGSSLGFSWD